MPSKPNVLIVGQSGSGKSASLEQLFSKYADRTAFLDFERKGMPFLYVSSKLAYYREVTDFNDSEKACNEVAASKASIIVYDSFSKFLDYAREHMRRVYNGWDVWNGYNAAINKFLEFNKGINRLTIMTSIDEVVYIETGEGGRVSRLRAAVQGKQYEGKLEKEFLVVLFTFAKKDKAGKIIHCFAPHTDGITSAKAPQWLGLQEEMPNDVSLIVDKLSEKGLL